MALADLDLGAPLSLTEWMSGLAGEPELGALDLGTGIPGVYELGAEAGEEVVRHYLTGIQESYNGDAAGWLTLTLTLATRPTRTDWFCFDDPTTGLFDGPGVLGYV
jgi:hypothetical protein